jgi:hypothetical protein
MTLSMKYDQNGLFHHPVTLPEFKLLRRYLDDACVKHDEVNIVMYANQLIPDLISEEADISKDKNPNIIELDTVDEANKVDSSVYRWSERMSAKTGKYVFVCRQIKRSK